jgi:hypothetical protein
MRKGRPRYFPQKHRNPPLPVWFMDCPWGVCRWCGKIIWDEDGTILKRRHWHKECLKPYWIITDCKYAKAEVKKRDKGICAYCGKYCQYRYEWELDHVKPLIDAVGDVTYWEMNNLQTLCNTCHERKTAQENSVRKTKKP